jgi:hypothetical protein
MNRIVLFILIFAISVYAGDIDIDDGAFEDLNSVFVGWLGGSLGKLLALIGFAIAIFTYVFAAGYGDGDGFYRMGLIGGTICVIAGGVVGISETFFGFGTGLF